MRVLVTGGAGFIGSNFVHYLLNINCDWEIAVLDKLTYSGRLENLEDIKHRIDFVRGDICCREDVEGTMEGCQFVFNFAAETHVDRSILSAEEFVETDVKGTLTLLNAARKYQVGRFVQISTDEVYGSTEHGSFGEEAALAPSSPYSASKAGADLLVSAYYRTYGLPVLITRSSNNFGPRQYPEKLIPLFTTNAIRDKPLPLYGDGLNVRDWLHVDDNCSAIYLTACKGQVGNVYNIASGEERTNREVAHLILSYLGKPEKLIQFVEDRPGHDRRYSLDSTKIKKLGWRPTLSFEEAMKRTLDWYRENEWWWKPLVD